MAMVNKFVSFFSKPNSGAAKVTQTALPPAIRSLTESVGKTALFRQYSIDPPKGEISANVWSTQSGYRTTPLARRHIEGSEVSSDTQQTEPLSEPLPRYTDSIQDYGPDEKDYTARLGSPIYCCSIFEDPSVIRSPIEDHSPKTAPQPDEYIWGTPEQVRVLNLEPTDAMVDDPSGEIYAPLRPGNDSTERKY